MVNHYECDVAIKALLAEKTILFPTDTVWSVGCLPYAKTALEQMIQLKPVFSGDQFEILFDSVDRLKMFVPFLHPKFQTLFAFHQRPLTVVINNARGFPQQVYNQHKQISIRIVQDPLCRHLIKEVDAPIITMPAASSNDNFPANFGAIRSDFLQGVDYVMKIRQRDLLEQAQLSVKVTLDGQEDFIFLRD